MTVIEKSTIIGSQSPDDIDVTRYLAKYRMVSSNLEITANIDKKLMTNMLFYSKESQNKLSNSYIDIIIPNGIEGLSGSILTNASNINVYLPDSLKTIWNCEIKSYGLTKTNSVNVYYNGSDPDTIEQIVWMFLGFSSNTNKLNLNGVKDMKSLTRILRRVVNLLSNMFYSSDNRKLFINNYPVVAQRQDDTIDMSIETSLIKSIIQSDSHIDYNDMFDLDDQVVVQRGYFSSPKEEIEDMDTIYSSGAMYSYKYRTQICTAKKYTTITHNDSIKYSNVVLDAINRLHDLYYSLLVKMTNNSVELQQIEDCYKASKAKYKEVEEYGHAIADVNGTIEYVLQKQYNIDMQKVLIPVYYHADKSLFVGYIIKLPAKFSAHNREKTVFRQMSDGLGFKNFLTYTGNNQQYVQDALDKFADKSRKYAKDKSFVFLDKCFETTKLLGQDIIITRSMQQYYSNLGTESMKDLTDTMAE